MNSSPRPSGAFAGVVAFLIFLAAVWVLIAPLWVGYRLTTSDWVTAAALAGSASTLGFWSIALAARARREP